MAHAGMNTLHRYYVSSIGYRFANVFVRDKRSREFTVTGSLMKLFQTGSATVVSDCMNFFHFQYIDETVDQRINQ